MAPPASSGLLMISMPVQVRRPAAGGRERALESGIFGEGISEGSREGEDSKSGEGFFTKKNKCRTCIQYVGYQSTQDRVRGSSDKLAGQGREAVIKPKPASLLRTDSSCNRTISCGQAVHPSG